MFFTSSTLTQSHVLMFTNTSAAADSFTDLLESVALDYKGRYALSATILCAICSTLCTV